MSVNQNKAIKICDTTLRDGHQSLMATRLKIEDMIPLLEAMDEVGFYSVECWGGATFDACLRYLNEDPWERLRVFRKYFKNTKLQMLLRGQNLLGYRPYPDDVIELFIKKMVDNGMDIIRVFDALNDLRNLETSIRAAKAEGAHVQGSVVYTISPVHVPEMYAKLAKELVEMGSDSICVKDMGGIISPTAAYNIVKSIKEVVDVPVELHTHYTSGMAGAALLKAAEAGVDIVDTALSPLAMGTSQPATETLVAMLKETPYDTGLDVSKMYPISAELRKNLRNYNIKYDVVGGVDANVLTYQVPGGMMSNFAEQLGPNIDRLPEVLEEVPRVRADLGYPPLVTPSSQMVGSQAVFNVLSGGRYKMVTNEVKAYLAGQYGKAPGPIDEEFRKSLIGDTPVLQHRFADDLEPGLPQARKEIGYLMESDEDLLSYVAFPQVAEKFLKDRMAGKTRTDYNIAEENEEDGKKGVYPVQ
ncbi:MAG: pyruvate carboxylase subunit B [Firmicutes bacterium]|nr:pyruvate carboxylase subunit B [Bacillota bacterium]